MSYQTYTDRTVNCVIIRHAGPIIHGEVMASMEDLFQDPAILRKINILRATGGTALPQTLGMQRSIKESRE